MVINKLLTEQSQGDYMLQIAVGLLIVAVIAAVLGFGGIAGAAAGLAKLAFFVFLLLFVVALVFGRSAV